ncbi:MAG TPA: PAS domain-containing protein [Candidatus Dormibacteraeota bacterium]|nr:PAS domain-containing protein [Candidatus Dormibacteraeota bacterium]
MNDKLISEIKATRAVLESALHNSGVAISQQDTDLKYTHFFNTHPGMAGAELIGKTDADWLPASEAAKLTAIKKRALEGKKGVREMFKSTLNGGNEGDIFYNDIRIEPIKEDDKVIGIYSIAIDITSFQKALMKLEELNGRLLKNMEDVLSSTPKDRGRK